MAPARARPNGAGHAIVTGRLVNDPYARDHARARAVEEALVATKDDRDAGSVETSLAVPAEGDDIVVVPPAPDEPRRFRALPALAGVTVALLIAGAIAIVARNNDSTPAVRTTSPTTIATRPIAATAHPSPTPAPASTVPAVVATTTPPTVAPQTVVTAAPVVTPATVAPLTLPSPTRQFGASALTWDAPASLTVASGKTVNLSVTAHNPTAGTVTLAHPLSCTPRLDHSEACPEMVQTIGAGQSASAQYTVDAHGIAPGHYSLRIEGVLTVPVTVS